MEAYRAVARNASIILAVSLQLSVCSWCCELKWRSLEEGFEVSQSERKRLQEPRCIGRRGKNECIPARVVDELLPPVVNGNNLRCAERENNKKAETWNMLQTPLNTSRIQQQVRACAAAWCAKVHTRSSCGRDSFPKSFITLAPTAVQAIARPPARVSKGVFDVDGHRFKHSEQSAGCVTLLEDV